MPTNNLRQDEFFCRLLFFGSFKVYLCKSDANETFTHVRLTSSIYQAYPIPPPLHHQAYKDMSGSSGHRIHSLFVLYIQCFVTGVVSHVEQNIMKD